MDTINRINNMGRKRESNDKKIPIVRIDNSLKKYKKIPLFQDKADKANEALRTIGLPKLTTK